MNVPIKNIVLSVYIFLFLHYNNNISTAENTAKNTSGKDALEAASQAGISAENINKNASSLSVDTLKKLAQNLDDHGWAIIDRIRNSTEFPVDIYFYKTLHDLLPPGTVVRIKSLKSEYSTLAAQEEDATLQETSADNSISTSTSPQAEVEPQKPKKVSLKDFDTSGSLKQSSDSEQDTSKPEQQETKTKTATPTAPETNAVKNFRYLAARNLVGGFRLKADTTNPDDPATRFIVRKYIDPNLNTYLGFESEVNAGQMLRTKKNNEIIFSANTMLEELIKDGKKSKDNFSSDFDTDSHWLLFSKSIKPTDPIDETSGRYLLSCNLKNQELDAFMSIRSAADEAAKSLYTKPVCYWYWTEGYYTKQWNVRCGFRGGWISGTEPDYDKRYTYHVLCDTMRMPISAKNLIPLSGSPASFEVVCERSLESTIPNGRIKNRYPGGEKVGAPDSWGIGYGPSFNAVNEINRGFDSNIYTKLEEGLMIINHARHYEYGPEKAPYKVQDGSLISFWAKRMAWSENKNNLCKRVLSKKREIKYGDKIKLVSTGSYFTLHAAGGNAVFGSHDDTEHECSKLESIKRSIPKAQNKTIADLSWFYIKGPHAVGDPWNCKIGDPVQDGDVIRLQHVLTGQNLCMVRGKRPAQGNLVYGPPNLPNNIDMSYRGSPAVVTIQEGARAACKYSVDKKPIDHELLVALNPKTDGVGSSDDNFTIKFVDPNGPNLCLGQTCSIIHQNSKHHLWSQHVINPTSNFGLITGLFVENDDDAKDNCWFCLCSETDTLPIQDVAWSGIPDGAMQRDAGDGEELAIEVVKLGLAGNLGAGETLSVQLPVYKKDPKVSGYAKDTILNFDIEKVVEISPLLGKGVAWLEESLSTPNKAGLFFKAKCQDSGDIQIYLGSSIGLDYIWKVVIGGGNNTSSYILKRDYPGGVPVEKKVVEVFKAQNPLAGAIPGQYIPYWLSIDNGLIILGLGQNMGENIIFAWRDLDQRESVNRIGFGSGDKAISYAEVKVTDPMDIKAPYNFYFSQSSPLDKNQDQLLQFNSATGKKNIIFKVPGNGTMTFNIQGKSGYLYFYEDEANKVYSTNLSSSDKANRIKENLASKIVSTLDHIRNMVAIDKFFQTKDEVIDDNKANKKSKSDKKTSPSNDKLKQDIFDYFVQRPDHVLTKLYESLSDDEKNSSALPAFKALNKHLIKELEPFTSEDLKKDLSDLVDKFAKEKLKDVFDKCTDKFEKDYLAVILNQKQISFANSEKAKKKSTASINPLTWIKDSFVNEEQSNISGVNDHYRIKFQSYEEVLKNRKKMETVIKSTLKEYCNNVVTEIFSKGSFSAETINAAIISQKKNLDALLKKNKLSSINVEEINNRFRSLSSVLADKNNNSDDIFEKAFPAPLITYFLQNMSGFAEACISLEKYSQTSKDYEILVSSKDQDVPTLDIATNQGKDFWLAFNKNRFFLGQGLNVGSDLFLFYSDIKNPLEDIINIGMSGEDTKLSKVKIGNTIKLSLREQDASYAVEKKVFNYKGSLQIISPYEYRLSQDDQQVKFSDTISKRTLFPGKTPQRGALYYFTLIIEPNGFPNLEWTKEPENKIKLELEKRAEISQANSDALMQAATYVQGQGALGGLVGVGASVVYSALGVTEGQKAGELNAITKGAFRSNDSYVFTDNMSSLAKLASDSIPPAAQANRAKVDEQLALGAKWTASDIDKFQRLLPLYDNVVNLIIHPYVIEGSKDQLFSGLMSVYKAHKLLFGNATAIDTSHLNLLELLFKVYNNPYLFDPNIKTDLKLKDTWYSYINELARKIMSIDKDKGITIPGCLGEYIWLNDKFKMMNKGSVSFLAKASNDIFVCFSETQSNVRNSDKDIYEVVFGAWDNTKTVIRAKSLDKAVAQTTNPDALVNPIDYKKFWVSFNNGRIIIGTGDLAPENAIGLYNPETRETITPEWNKYSYETTINKDWLKYAIGDTSGFVGKDLLLKMLEEVTDEDEKTRLSEEVDKRQTQLTALFDKKQYAYQTNVTDQGFYNTAPFMWQDPYFNPTKFKFDKVGISSWNSEISLQQVKVSVCVEEVDLYLKNLMAQINNKNNAPIFSEDKSVEDYRNKVLAAIAAKPQAVVTIPKSTPTKENSSNTGEKEEKTPKEIKSIDDEQTTTTTKPSDNEKSNESLNSTNNTSDESSSKTNVDNKKLDNSNANTNEEDPDKKTASTPEQKTNKENTEFVTQSSEEPKKIDTPKETTSDNNKNIANQEPDAVAA